MVVSVVCTLYAGLHQLLGVGQREDVTEVEHLAHVDMEELQAGGEGHPEELHLLALLLGQALVSEVSGQMLADGHGQLLGLLPSLSQLISQLQAVCAPTYTGGQVPVARNHLYEAV